MSQRFLGLKILLLLSQQVLFLCEHPVNFLLFSTFVNLFHLKYLNLHKRQNA